MFEHGEELTPTDAVCLPTEQEVHASSTKGSTGYSAGTFSVKFTEGQRWIQGGKAFGTSAPGSHFLYVMLFPMVVAKCVYIKG